MQIYLLKTKIQRKVEYMTRKRKQSLELEINDSFPKKLGVVNLHKVSANCTTCM